MHVYIHQMTKVISISDDAYELLQSVKGENESFTKVILRVAEKEKQKPLASFFGALSEESAQALEKEIKETRALHRKLHAQRLSRMT